MIVTLFAISSALCELNAQNIKLLGKYDIPAETDSVTAMTITENPYNLSFSNLI